MKNLHKMIIPLVIGYTLMGAVVFTVIISCLSLVGWVTFEFPEQQEKLFYILIVEIIVISVGQFKGWLNFNPAAVQGKIISDSGSAKERLWELTFKISRNIGTLSKDLKSDLEAELSDWYFKDGGGMYLSLKSADLFLKAKASLLNTDISDEAIRDNFSKLRTQLKIDAGVYSQKDAETQIGP